MYAEGDLRKIQLLILYAMKEIDKLCKDNDIIYYLIGGTLLGAVRHKGFIPWDDDLDIVMMRDDYEKFRHISKKLPSFLTYQDFDSNDEHIRIFSKVLINDSIFESSCEANYNCNKGFFVDIFPIDNIKNIGGILLELRAKIGLAYSTAIPMVRGKRQPPNIKWRAISYIVKLIGQKNMKEILKWALTCDNHATTRYTTNFGSHYGYKKQIFERSLYGKPRYVEFEDNLFYAPQRYEEYLIRIFGEDYMQLPPEEKRVSGHDVVRYDFRNVLYLINEA